jgi:hypothetical protein
LDKDHWIETTGAISWYINSHNLKIQTDYTDIHREGLIATTNAGVNAKSTDDKLIRVQAQLLF